MISVILNVYNGEKYLAHCIQSVLRQTYINFELLIINDGSTDNTPIIAESFQAKDKRVIVYNTENKGLSGSRHFGLSKVNEEYIIFIDCDDYIEGTFLEKLYNALVTQNADMAICEYYEEYEDYQKHIHIKNQVQTEEYTRDLIRGRTWNVVWNKLIKTAIVRQNQITFPTEIRYWEDVPFSVCYSLYCNKIAYVNEPLYHYIKSNTESLTATEGINLKFNQDRVKILPIIEKHLNITHKYPQFEADIIWLKFWIKDTFIRYKVNKQRINLWYDSFPEVNKRWKEYTHSFSLYYWALANRISGYIYIDHWYWEIRHFIKRITKIKK